MVKESQEKRIEAEKREKEIKEAVEDMEELSELPEDKFKREKEKTLEELGIPKDRAEGFLEGPENDKKPKKD